MNNSYVILDAMEMPAKAGRGAGKGSKFFTDEIAATVAQLQAKQGFVIPFMEMDGVKDPAKRQRYAHEFRIKQWAKEQPVADGAKPMKFTVGIIMPAKNPETGEVIKDGGIAVRREI